MICARRRSRGRCIGGRFLAGSDDPCDRDADRDYVTFLRFDSGENAIGRRLDFNNGFIGFDFENGSPLVMASPSFFSHEMIFPVSCAISSAGITTLVAIIVLFRICRLSP